MGLNHIVWNAILNGCGYKCAAELVKCGLAVRQRRLAESFNEGALVERLVPYWLHVVERVGNEWCCCFARLYWWKAALPKVLPKRPLCAAVDDAPSLTIPFAYNFEKQSFVRPLDIAHLGVDDFS